MTRVSASEKLRALRDASEAERMNVLEFSYPELVAVVEAAERINDAPAGNRYGFLPLDNALDALNKALF